jgi:hypothetical protein
MDKDNKKLPDTKLCREEVTAKHPYTTGQCGMLGDSEYCFASPKEPENYFVQKTRASGSYETIDYDSSKAEIITKFNPGENRNYCAGGNSNQVDGNDDVNIESTSRTNVAGDRGVSCKTAYHVSTEGSVIAHNRSKKEFVVAASDSVSFNGSFGDQVNEHSGNWHESFEKDHVSAITGNKITMIKEGEYAIHTQKGNFDLQVTEGQLHLMTSGGDLIANSNVKVLLQVGSQSKVTIDPSSIKLQVGGGSYIEITAGEIKMVSPKINLN